MVRLLAPFHVAKTIGRGVKSGEVGRGRDDSSGIESGTFWTVAASSQQTSRGATLSLLNKGANPSNGCSRDRKKNKIGSVFSTPHRTLFRSDSRFAESTIFQGVLTLVLDRSPQIYLLEYPSFEMSETTEKNSPGCSPFQAFEMENRTIKLEQRPSHPEMQAGTAIPAQGKEVASIRKQVRSKKKTAEAETPDWFPKGWKTEIKYRESGATAGSCDKYYVEEATGYRFRSKREVKSYLESGKKPKPKSRLLGSVRNEASAAPPSTNSLIFRTPDLNAPPQREAELEHVKALTKSKQQRPASDGQKQGQHWDNQNASEMWGLHNSVNTEKTPKMAHPVTGKALDYDLASSFTPASQGGFHFPEQNDNLLSRHDGLVSTGETVLPPDMLVVDISNESPENTASKPSETGSRASEWQFTKQSMAPSVSDQAGCHGYLNSHNQPCYPIMPLVNGLLNPGHCSTILGGSLKAVPFSGPPRSPRSVLHHNSDIFHSDLQVQHNPCRGRPKGSKNVGNPREMKRQLAEQLAERGRMLCKQYLRIAKRPPPA